MDVPLQWISLAFEFSVLRIVYGIAYGSCAGFYMHNTLVRAVLRNTEYSNASEIRCKWKAVDTYQSMSQDVTAACVFLRSELAKGGLVAVDRQSYQL